MTAMEQISFQTTKVNGIDVHILPTEKFKTTTIMLMIQQALSEEHVTKTSLLSMLMKRATAKFPTSKQLREHLDFMYGAIFDVDVVKKGERQILQVYIEVPNEKYLQEKASLVEQAIQFLGDVLCRPYLEGEAFSPKYVQIEKEALHKRLESLINDKMRYANQRVTEEMAKGEPFSLLVYGRAEDLPEIDGAQLYSYLRQLRSENPIDIFVVGNVESHQIQEYIKEHLPLERTTPRSLPEVVTTKAVTEVREVVDRLDVTQAKLNIGCRTNISYKDDSYPALVMANGVLGGFPHSKLFINVREKASLAYYAVSRLESHKGILMMMSGIDVRNYEKAVTIMKQQLEQVQAGQFNEDELSQTRATVTNQYRELLDSARAMIDFTYNGVISGRKRSLSELLTQIAEVSPEEIQQAAKQIQIDTIYLLRDRKEGN